MRYLTAFLAACLSVASFAFDVPCLDPLACNFMEEGECFFTDENGDPCVIEGCTIEGACNFDPEADIYDGSCEFVSCLGCTDFEACNYDETALYDDASCIYYVDCNGTCGGDWIEDACGNCYEANVFDTASITIHACAASGISGPDSSQCDYEEYNSLIEISGGIQFFTVPEDGVYRIEAIGAAGGGTEPGWGAKVSGDFNLAQGEILKILIGQVGTEETYSRDFHAGGGGGGTFVAKAINNECLIVAGGGGGCGADGVGSNAIFYESGENTGAIGEGGACFDGLAGAGYFGGGCNSGGHPGGTDAGSFISGGNGGYGSPQGGQGAGGFGGGGGEGYADGGGGGYSGGNGANGDGIGGFGGSSFNSGDNPTEDGYHSGAGFVTITWETEPIIPFCNPGCTYPQACNYNPESNFDDGSCDYCFCGEGTQWVDSLQACMVTEAALMQACGEGTYWDDLTQACLTIETCQEDLDGDGVIGVNDLLELLSSFGTECVADSETAEWTCGDPLNYQGYYYETVQIGEQCWFAENLRTEAYQNGDIIPAQLSDLEWTNTLEGATTIYGEGNSEVETGNSNELENLLSYGRLYNWYAVDDIRGLCPASWHVPTDEEFIVLEITLGMSESEANTAGWRGTDQGWQLKSSAIDSPSWDGTNLSGFSALAGGNRNDVTGNFNGGTQWAIYWTSSIRNPGIWSRTLGTGEHAVRRHSHAWRDGMSVRCMKDSE